MRPRGGVACLSPGLAVARQRLGLRLRAHRMVYLPRTAWTAVKRARIVTKPGERLRTLPGDVPLHYSGREMK
eukprot:4459388-Alexandrium_andersonii.AAC.1